MISEADFLVVPDPPKDRLNASPNPTTMSLEQDGGCFVRQRHRLICSSWPRFSYSSVAAGSIVSSSPFPEFTHKYNVGRVADPKFDFCGSSLQVSNHAAVEAKLGLQIWKHFFSRKHSMECGVWRIILDFRAQRVQVSVI